MPKKPMGLAALEGASAEEEETPVVATPAANDRSESDSVVSAPVRTIKRKPDPRINGTIYMLPAIHDQVRRLAFDAKVKHNTVFLRGLDLLFQQTPGLSSIKELTGIDVWGEEA